MERKVLRIDCYRHGESAANAGLATDDPASIPLTEVGHRQAEEIACSPVLKPDLIISSPFLRACQTAEPSARRFGLPIQTWPIQEFTYLAPARCKGTTAMQRKKWVEEYWAASDSGLVDGEGAESFASFIHRVREAIRRLDTLRDQSKIFVMVFGHGQFLRAMRWLIEEPGVIANAAAMQRFREMDLESPIENGASFSLWFDEKETRQGEEPQAWRVL